MEATSIEYVEVNKEEMAQFTKKITDQLKVSSSKGLFKRNDRIIGASTEEGFEYLRSLEQLFTISSNLTDTAHVILVVQREPERPLNPDLLRNCPGTHKIIADKVAALMRTLGALRLEVLEVPLPNDVTKNK